PGRRRARRVDRERRRVAPDRPVLGRVALLVPLLGPFGCLAGPPGQVGAPEPQRPPRPDGAAPRPAPPPAVGREPGGPQHAAGRLPAQTERPRPDVADAAGAAHPEVELEGPGAVPGVARTGRVQPLRLGDRDRDPGALLVEPGRACLTPDPLLV